MQIHAEKFATRKRKRKEKNIYILNAEQHLSCFHLHLNVWYNQVSQFKLCVYET